MGAESRLSELGIELPGLQPAVGNYLASKREGGLVFVSEHDPIKLEPNGLLPGKTSREISVEDALGALVQGKVGGEVSVEEAREPARLTGLFLLSACAQRSARSIGSGRC